MPLTKLPFGLPGRIFRSVMPFGMYDLSGEVFESYKRQGVSVVTLLAGEAEYLAKAQRDLKAMYQAEGWTVIHAPIADFSIPSSDALGEALEDTIAHANAGRHVVVHCNAGVGRTGLFAAILARKILELPGAEAISWVRRYIPNAVETPEQKAFVLGFQC